MTEIFRSKENQAHFDEFGYVILDARLESEADEMSRFIEMVLIYIFRLTSMKVNFKPILCNNY